MSLEEVDELRRVRESGPAHAGRALMMPRRKRTRAADHAQRIKRERALNDAYVAERNKPPPL